MESLLTILQWLVPSGGVGAVLVWLTSRTLRQTRETKEVHDTYKLMYEDMRDTITLIQHDNNQLQESVAALRRLVLRSTTCRHYHVCPLRDGLQYIQSALPSRAERPNDARKERQHHPRDTDLDDADHPTGYGADGAPSDEPP